MSVVLLSFLLSMSAAATLPQKPKPSLARELLQVREQILKSEKDLISNTKELKATGGRVQHLKSLQKLQKAERTLAAKRIGELKKYLEELTARKTALESRMNEERRSLTRLVETLDSLHSRSSYENRPAVRSVVTKLVELSLQRAEALRMDRLDVDEIEGKIEQEHLHLTYLMNDLEDQAQVLKFHESIQNQMLAKMQTDSLSQVERVHRLKSTQLRVEQLIEQFNARLAFERTTEAEKQAARSVYLGDFVLKKGKLGLPVAGKLVQGYGRDRDPASGLSFFRKGIEFAVQPETDVRAVAPGRVVFAGELQDFGLVTIIDHGANYYSLVAQLGTALRKEGDFVGDQEAVGKSDSKGTPVYFEIRSRNVPVNPIGWLQAKLEPSPHEGDIVQ